MLVSWPIYVLAVDPCCRSRPQDTPSPQAVLEEDPQERLPATKGLTTDSESAGLDLGPCRGAVNTVEAAHEQEQTLEAIVSSLYISTDSFGSFRVAQL